MNNKEISRCNNIKYKIAVDVILNLVGTLIPVAIIHLIIFPQLAKHIATESYGLIQSTMALVYLVGATFGDSLCSARLLKKQDYIKKDVIGDFNLINACSVILLILVTPIILIFYLKIISIYEVFLDSLIMILSYCCGYYFVRYRLEIDYVQIFINHVIGSIGYLVGYGLFLFLGTWQIIYIVYFTARLGHLLPKSPLLKETLRRTDLFREVMNAYVGLNISTILSKMLSYFDKIILYPILGGGLVSIYFTANILGKIVAQITTPLTNVILTYLSKEDGVSKKTWNQILLCGGVIGCISYFICIGISKPVICILYPQWASEAMIYIPITTASLCVASYAAVLTPFVLKMIDARYQIVINGTSALIYCLFILLWANEGLMACCISILISNIVKAFLTIIIPLVVQGKEDDI